MQQTAEDLQTLWIRELAKMQYSWMPLRFKRLVSLENPLLPYYTELINLVDASLVPARHSDIWTRLHRPKDEYCPRCLSCEFGHSCDKIVRIPSWKESNFFCPFGCLVSQKKHDIAWHLLHSHSEFERKPWCLSSKQLSHLIEQSKPSGDKMDLTL